MTHRVNVGSKKGLRLLDYRIILSYGLHAWFEPSRLGPCRRVNDIEATNGRGIPVRT